MSQISLYIKDVQQFDTDAKQVEISQLRDIVDASCSAILVGNILDYISYDEREKLLWHICTKVAYNGEIHIGGSDIEEICRGLMTANLDVQNTNKLILTKNKKSISTLLDMANIIEKYGFLIINKRADSYNYYIKAKRNGPNT